MEKAREIATDVMSEFEEYLGSKGIQIPNKERDEYDGEEPAILFGTEYYGLEDGITEMISKELIQLFLTMYTCAENGNTDSTTKEDLITEMKQLIKVKAEEMLSEENVDKLRSYMNQLGL